MAMAANSLTPLTVSSKHPQVSPPFTILPLSAQQLPFPCLFTCRCPPQSRVASKRISQFVRRRSLPGDGDGDAESESMGVVDALRVPDHWLIPSRASEEAEWLRITLHKWLDDEYCPEPTNVEISKLAAESYYRSLLQKTTDLGEILLKMARELESISYQESFHGAFSSANAAISLIAERLEQV